MACTPKADDTFGPVVGQGCRDDFDFTLAFEQYIFQIAPCAILLLLVPVRATQLHAQSVKVLRNGTKVVKQLAIAVLASTQLALLILWSLTPMYRTAASIPAAVVSFLASLALMYLSSIEHARSISPSALINTYMLFSLLFDIPQARTLWLRPGPRALPAIFTSAIVAKVMIFYLEARSKRRVLFPIYSIFGPESLASLYSLATLWWLNPLFWKGYKTLLSTDMLYTVDSSLQSNDVGETFLTIWGQQLKTGRWALVWTTCRCVRSTFFLMVIPRLCNSALKLSQALFIKRLTSLLSHQQNEEKMREGRGLIGAAALIYVGMALTTALYQRQEHRLTTKVRGIVVTAVYSKSLHVSSEKLADNAALTLISADVERITTSLARVIDLIATPVEVGVAIFLLEQEIGIACIAPVALTIAVSCISFFNSNYAVAIQKRWLKAVSTRVAYTSAVLNCPKGFKMLGLGEYFTEHIQHLRVLELHEYAEYRKYVTWRNVFSYIPQSMAPVLSLMVFTLVNGQYVLNPTNAFTALSLVALMTDPIQSLIHAVPLLQTVFTSLERIQAFLLLEDDGQFAIERHIVDNNNLVPEDGHHGNDVELSVVLNNKEDLAASTAAVRIYDGSVLLGKTPKQILHNIGIEVAPSKLTLIVGPVGSGKSTLLKVILGDIALSEGTRTINKISDSFSFCSQDPWLPNDTVKHIICGQSTFETDWYTTTMRACALIQDVASFPDGEDTLIGTKGISLSGGQRQRLALARAVYSRKKVLIADDVLSGLDARNAKHVFDHVFGSQGLCKKFGTTAILATHARQYIKQADHIVALDSSGTIREQGSFAELDRPGSYVYELKHQTVNQNMAQDPHDTVVDPVINAKVAGIDLSDPQLDLAKRTGDVEVYGYYVRSIGPRLTIVFAIFTLAHAFGGTFPDIWVRFWSDAEASRDGQHPLGLWIGIYVLISAISILGCYGQIWTMLIWVVPKSSAQLHRQILDVVMHAKYSFFTTVDSGVTLNRFSTDMSLIEGSLSGAVLQTSTGIGLVAGSGALIAVGADYAAATLPFILFVLYCLQRFYLRTSRQLRNLQLETQAPLITHCSETLAGVTTIRAFGWQHHAHQKMIDLLDKSQRPFYLLLCVQRWLNLVLGLLTAGFAIVVVAMATLLPGTSSAGAIGVSLLNVLNFSSTVSYVITAWTNLETSLGAVARCKNFETSTASEDKPEERHIPAPDWPNAGQVEISNVSASYSAEDEPVLKSISLIIAAGEKVGICGRSGSGKSSLLLTLFRLLDNSSGSIIVDGIDLSTVPRQTIRERFSALPQETISFPGTLRTNLDPFAIASDAEALEVLRKVGLHDKTASQGGLDAEMTSLNLSQGEMQLFAIARALLRKSRILALDEMTSSVDSITEETMLGLIRDEFAASTVIAVAHRLKTIIEFDKIIVMDKGRIVEVGAPAELLKLPKGIFREMWEHSGGH